MVSTCTALIPTYYRRYIDPEICQSTWPFSTRLFLLTKSQKMKKKNSFLSLHALTTIIKGKKKERRDDVKIRVTEIERNQSPNYRLLRYRQFNQSWRKRKTVLGALERLHLIDAGESLSPLLRAPLYTHYQVERWNHFFLTSPNRSAQRKTFEHLLSSFFYGTSTSATIMYGRYVVYTHTQRAAFVGLCNYYYSFFF